MLRLIIKENKFHLILLVLIILINSLLILKLPEEMNHLITSAINTQNKLIYSYSFKMLIYTLFIITSSLIMNYLSAKISAKIAYLLRKNIFEKTINFQEKDYLNISISILITRSTSDINHLQNAFNLGFKNLVFALIIAPLGIIRIFNLSSNFLLTIIIFVSIIIITTFLLILLLLTTPKVLRLQNNLEKLNQKTRESLNGLMTIKSFNAQKYEIKKYNQLNTTYSELDYQINKIMNLLNPFTTLIINCIIIFITWSLLKNTKDASSISLIITYNQYTIQIISSFLTLVILFILFPKAKISYKRIQEILKYQTTNYQNIKFNLNNKITINNLTFNYCQNTTSIIKKLTLTIPLKQKIAFVGPTGSGKSTILKLLTNTYQNYTGTIYYDQTDIKNISPKQINELITFIPQKSYIFQGTIRSNLQISNININDRKIKELLKTFNLNEFHPNSPISSQGQNLSGGQKQRLTLARGLARNTKIYIIDDIFSGLDNLTITTIKKNLTSYLKDKTLIVSSSTIKNIKDFDLIILLNNGQITAMGKHEELLNNDIYSTMYQKEVDYEKY